MISRTRGYLPHKQIPQATYFVTFRLEDSLPSALLFSWKQELESKKILQKNKPRVLNALETEYYAKVQQYLDGNAGHCWLKNSKIAQLVVGALRYFNGQRYMLHAWTIMPNHVHVLLSINGDAELSSILHSWKSFTANQANRLLGRSGRFWQPEYFDRLVKSERQFEFTIRYILNNPVKAKLCADPFQWPSFGCAEEIQELVKRFFV